MCCPQTVRGGPRLSAPGIQLGLVRVVRKLNAIDDRKINIWNVRLFCLSAENLVESVVRGQHHENLCIRNISGSRPSVLLCACCIPVGIFPLALVCDSLPWLRWKLKSRRLTAAACAT